MVQSGPRHDTSVAMQYTITSHQFTYEFSHTSGA